MTDILTSACRGEGVEFPRPSQSRSEGTGVVDAGGHAVLNE